MRSDSTFGTGGVATVPGNSSSTPPNSFSEAVAIQPNGQIVIAGALDLPLGGGSNSQYTPDLIRLNANGSQDTTLAQAGIVASGLQVPFAMTVEPDGNLLAPSSASNFESLSPFPSSGITLVSPDGCSTSASGYGTVPDAPKTAQVVAMANGDVVVSGVTGSFSAFRLTPSLHPDYTFGVNNYGVASVNVPLPPLPPGSYVAESNAEGLTVAPNGQILLVGGAAPGGTGADLPGYLAVVRLKGTATPATPGDYNGDGISDIALYLPAYGSFAITNSSGGPGEIVPFGVPGPGQTIPAPGDYYGTGQEDIAAYLPPTAAYAIKDPTGQTAGMTSPSASQARPVHPRPGDYYGTGQDDIAVYMPSIAVFAILAPRQRPARIVQFGHRRRPVDPRPRPITTAPARPTSPSTWPRPATSPILDPTGKTSGELIPFGKPGLGQSIPVPGDYDGSGKTELAVYVPSVGAFFYRPANGGPDVIVPIGMPGSGETCRCLATTTARARPRRPSTTRPRVLRLPAGERRHGHLRFDRHSRSGTDDPGDNGGALAIPRHEPRGECGRDR